MTRKSPRFALVAFMLLPAPVIIRADAQKSNDAPSTQQSPATQPAVKKITLAEFKSIRQEKDAITLDVRTPKEFAAGHVPGAINIDWHRRDFNDKVAALDKSKKIVVHCMAGGRSAAATARMSTLGFEHLYNYSGGFSEYTKASEPVEK